jgi:hypothetical protein
MTPDLFNLVGNALAFESIIGVSPTDFGAMTADIRPAVAAVERQRRNRHDRRRAPGAGRKPR